MGLLHSQQHYPSLPIRTNEAATNSGQPRQVQHEPASGQNERLEALEKAVMNLQQTLSQVLQAMTQAPSQQNNSTIIGNGVTSASDDDTNCASNRSVSKSVSELNLTAPNNVTEESVSVNGDHFSLYTTTNILLDLNNEEPDVTDELESELGGAGRTESEVTQLIPQHNHTPSTSHPPPSRDDLLRLLAQLTERLNTDSVKNIMPTLSDSQKRQMNKYTQEILSIVSSNSKSYNGC